MRSLPTLFAAALLATTTLSAVSARADDKTDKADKTPILQPTQSLTDGSVTIGGQKIDYQAAAGTLIVHPKGWDDQETTAAEQSDKAEKKSAQASMFYVAYFKKGAAAAHRPITFLFNGGPGSSSVWLHMGAFGPRRVITPDDSHPNGAPYKLVNNDESLLDVSDLVFIDAPGTGFSRVVGHDGSKAFYGIDQDGHAFTNFIAEFLSKYRRWDSPKYLFGESYGTTRSAVLSYDLENDQSIDLNGVILLSQILAFDNSIDGPEFNPGEDMPYILALPSFAATAWYHHKLGTQGDLPTLLKQVEQFATTDYAQALGQGDALDSATRDKIAAKLHDYTSLPVDYIKKSDLRINGGQFEKMLLTGTDTTTGRLDSRFAGPSMDPLSKESAYDPQSAAISAAYVATFNDYVRQTLHYGDGMTYKAVTEIGRQWDMKHQPPGAHHPARGSANVMLDLAAAMKYDPKLQVMLNAGYFDLATPFYEGIYEMQHLPIPTRLDGNIEFKQYDSGHMVYAHLPSLKKLHDNVAAFIGRTDNQGSGATAQ
ncbi:S10 family peptidase [Lichenicoccus sp.]|uniref:S10 family peptidase n=1 Tax=Lichenicoccus sp. TaxID=2781899 RepID=UPI003D0FB189